MKKYLFPIFSSCLAALLCINQSHAEPANDFISEHLVTFSPPILEGNNHYPCHGIRVSSKVLLTSDECARLISDQIGSGVSVKVLSKQRQPFGEVRLLTHAESKIGLLGLNTQKVLTKSEQPYPTLEHNISGRLKPAKAFYQPLSGDGIQVVPLILIYHRTDTHHHYIVNASETLPAGTPVVHDGKVVCTAGPDQTCKSPVFDKKRLERVKLDCKDIYPDLVYSGCVNRTVTSCSSNLWETKSSGTCINSKSGETCLFSSDLQHATGTTISDESVTCPSCRASFHEDLFYNDPPSISNTCKPISCVEGCSSSAEFKGQNNQQNPGKVQESCNQCLAQEQQMFNNCQQICQAGFSYQACKSCSEAVDREEAYCKSICDPGTFAGGL